MPMPDSCWCMAEPDITLWTIIVQLKINTFKNWVKKSLFSFFFLFLQNKVFLFFFFKLWGHLIFEHNLLPEFSWYLTDNSHRYVYLVLTGKWLLSIVTYSPSNFHNLWINHVYSPYHERDFILTVCIFGFAQQPFTSSQYVVKIL